MDQIIRKNRTRNFLLTIVGMVAIFGFYIYTASQAPVSDNIGILVVPFSLLLFHGPVISGLYAFTQARTLARTHDNFTVSLSSVFQNMPIMFKVLGVVGLIAQLIISVTIGLSATALFILFPFWAIEYLF